MARRVEPQRVRQRRRTSSANLIGVCRDGLRLVLIYDHRLDNTRHPRSRDFQLLVDGRSWPVHDTLLTSPMVENSGCAAVILRLGRQLPPRCELKVYYLPAFSGMLSMVDRRHLAPMSMVVHCDEGGCALGPEQGEGIRLSLANGASAALQREPALDRLLAEVRRFADNGWRYATPAGSASTVAE